MLSPANGRSVDAAQGVPARLQQQNSVNSSSAHHRAYRRLLLRRSERRILGVGAHAHDTRDCTPPARQESLQALRRHVSGGPVSRQVSRPAPESNEARAIASTGASVARGVCLAANLLSLQASRFIRIRGYAHGARPGIPR